MKILFLTRRFYPDVGGVEKHVYEITKRLIKKGHKVTVVTQSQATKNVGGIEVIRIPKTPNNSSEKLHIWKWFWKNRSLFRDSGVIHAHDVFFWYWPFKLLFPSKKSFITFHGYESYPISKKAKASRKLSEYLANGNIIVGEFIKKWYETKPDYVIYGGVEIPKTIGKPKSLSSAVFFGRLDEQTGILDYVKAVDLIREEYPRFKFKIIGNGKYRNKLKSLKPLEFQIDPVKFLRDYNYAFVSRYLSILEALASKRMVFAIYDNPMKEDYLKMAPFSNFIVIATDPKNLARKVKYFLNNSSEANKFTNKGFVWAKEQSWDKVVNTYLNLWKKN